MCRICVVGEKEFNGNYLLDNYVTLAGWSLLLRVQIQSGTVTLGEFYFPDSTSVLLCDKSVTLQKRLK